MAPDPRVQALTDQVVWDDILADLEWLLSLGVRYSWSEHIYVVGDSLEARLAATGLPTEVFDATVNGAMDNPNFIVTQLGTVYPDSVYVLCAHYDATSDEPLVSTPGADDNGTGTVAVLTAMRLLADLPLKCTVKYVLFSGEEQGLWGSSAWAADQAAQGVNIAGALNFDMIGFWEEGAPFDLEIGTNLHSRWLAEATANCATIYAGMPYELHEAEDIEWSDHWSFWEQGYAAVQHEEAWEFQDLDFNPHYHSTTDLIEFLDPDFTTGNVRVAVSSLATLAGLAGQDSVSAVAATPTPGGSLTAYPNPFNGRTHLLLEVAGFEGPLDADVYDLRGRHVRSVALEVRDGRAEVGLAAVDDNGRAFATGVYFVRVVLPDGPVSARIAYVR